MITTTIRISRIEEGTGCMSPLRYTDGCFECNRVDRCPNMEAIDGRMIVFRKKRNKLKKMLKKVEDCLAEYE